MKPAEFKNALIKMMNEDELTRIETYTRKQHRWIEAWKVRKDKKLLEDIMKNTGIKDCPVWIILHELRSAEVLRGIYCFSVAMGPEGPETE